MSKEENWSGRHLAKDALRKKVWTQLREANVAIGNPFQSIPDFLGSDRAAEQLAGMELWKESNILIFSPDLPQIPVRKRALDEEKLIYMAVPKLVDERCFVKLSKEIILARNGNVAEAATWQGALKWGEYVRFEEMLPADMSVTGCVAVTREGGRTGKGAGFADLEHALLKRFGLITDQIPIITTVHPLMIVDETELPLQPHDTRLTMIVTPNEIIHISGTQILPALNWSQVRAEQIDSIPILRYLAIKDGYVVE